MSYIVVENFRYGLDARRSSLTSILGSLVTLENAFVNQGAEVEKRRAFVPTNIVTNGSLTTYGMEALRDSIAVFGGTIPASGVLLGSVVIGATSYPVNYYRLWLHNGAATPVALPFLPNAPVVATAVVYSTVFANQPFVIATMSNGTTVWFYGGVLVPAAGGVPAYYNATPIKDSFMGRAVTGMTRDNFLDMLAQSVTDGGNYTGAHTTGTDKVVVTGPVGRQVNGVATETGAAWTITGALTSTNNVPSTAAKAASGSFRITGGSVSAGVNKITSVKVGAQELLVGPGTAIDFTGTNVDTALLVVNSINAYTATSGYYAQANGDQVTVFANTAGAAANNGTLMVVAAGNVTIGHSCIEFMGTAFTVDYIKVGGKVLLPLTAGGATSLAYDGTTQTLNAFIASIVTAINGSGTLAGSSFPIRAFSSGPKLILSQTTTTCTDPPVTVDLSVTPTASTDSGKAVVCGGGVLTVSITPDSVYLATSVTGYALANPVGGSGGFRAVVSGGAGEPYVYNWKITMPSDSPISTYLTSKNAQSTFIGAGVVPRWYDARAQDGRASNIPHGMGTLEVSVTDANGNVATASVSVAF